MTQIQQKLLAYLTMLIPLYDQLMSIEYDNTNVLIH